MPSIGALILAAVSVGLSLGCAAAPDRFESRVAFFREFAHSLPSCAAGDVASPPAELLGQGPAPDDRVSVRGHPSLICVRTEQLLGTHRRSEKTAEPGYCEGHSTLWVLWDATSPTPSPLRPDGPACISLSANAVTDAVVLHPRPLDLLDCDVEAVERAVPQLTIIATGVVLEAPPDALPAARRTDLDVERICRVDRPTPPAR